MEGWIYMTEQEKNRGNLFSLISKEIFFKLTFLVSSVFQLLKKLRELEEIIHKESSLNSKYKLNAVQAWESGDRNPNHDALRLLEIIDKGIYRPQIQRRISR